MGWVANAFLVVSWYYMPRPRAMVLGVIGSLLWAMVGLREGLFDLVFIELTLGALGVRAFLKVTASENALSR
jgi:hypothetical protein